MGNTDGTSPIMVHVSKSVDTAMGIFLPPELVEYAYQVPFAMRMRPGSGKSWSMTGPVTALSDSTDAEAPSTGATNAATALAINHALEHIVQNIGD